MLELAYRIQKSEPLEVLFELTEEYGKYGECAPLKRIFQTVLFQGCKTILAEYNYEDRGWANEHKKFYHEVFKKYSDKTVRLHFFTSEINEESFANLQKYEETYLGFCVLRPLEAQKVSEAIIKPVEDKNKPAKSFVLCQEDFYVDIKVDQQNQQRLKIRGTPFIQQDGQLGCCSHAAIAMVDNILIHGRDKPKGTREISDPYLIGDIAELVYQLHPYAGGQRPTRGLSSLHISDVLKSMGYFPLVYEFQKDKKTPFTAERLIYYYLESKIPVILGIPVTRGNHALTVIGHSFEPDLWWGVAEMSYYSRTTSDPNYRCSTTWVQNFIVHDDNFGPYLTIPKELIWAFTAENLMVIVPLPMQLNIRAEVAESTAYNTLLSIADFRKNEESLTNQTFFEWFNIFYKHLMKNDLVLRTWLVESKQFKETSVSSVVRDIYEYVKMPEKIWLTEVSIPELFCQKRLRFGEVIIDPTGAEDRTSFLSIHVPGFMATRDADTEKIDFFNVDNDRPLEHVIR